MRFLLLILILANSAIASDFESAGHLFEEKKFVEAFAGFEAASLASHSPTLRQACFYNMGNCAFRVAEEDENMPMEWYRQSIQCFRAALRLGAGEDAAFNLELASWRMKQFENSPQDSDQPSDEGDPSDEGEGEGESSESGEEGEMEEEGDYSEDAEAADSSSMPRGDTSMSDLESQTTPPPGVTPDDLLQEEALNNAQRQKSKSRKGGGVEQDW